MIRSTRRSWLRAGALALGFSPFVRTLSRALAQEPVQQLERLVWIYMPHGVARELWRPGPGFDLGYADASLSPFLDAATYGRSFAPDLLVIEGLDLSAGIEGGSAGHQGSRAMLTGSAFEARNASIDQYLAEEVGLGRTSPIASLVLGVGSAALDIGACISYASGGSPLTKIVDPSRTFDEAFGKWIVGDDPAALARAAVARRRGESALDVLRADLAALGSRAGRAEAAELDGHLTALRALEKRLAGFELQCEAPPAPAVLVEPPSAASQLDRVTDLQIDLLAAAFACGVTRFATLYLADLSHTRLDPTLPDDIHGEVAHRYAGAADDGSSPGRPETWLPLARHNRYSYGKVARLLGLLDRSGLLASTLVVAMSDMGDPAKHSSRNVPTVIAGGAAAGVRGGRYWDVRQAGSGVPHNRLLVSICRAFGVAVEQFGEARTEIVRGALDGLV